MPDTTEPEIFRDFREAHREVMTNPRYGVGGIMSAEEKLARMNEPKASLEHFYGRQVESVDENEEGWSIRLEGGIVISNKGTARPMPEDIVGKVLLLTVFSETDTRLQFGLSSDEGVQEEEWVLLAPTKYTISGLEGQTQEYYPQMPEELESVLPPDPSSERIVDGPEEAQESTE